MKIISSLLIFLILFQFSVGQYKIDSLQAELQKTSEDTAKVKLIILLWEATAYSNMDQAREYARQALSLSIANNYSRGLANSYYRIAILFNNIGEYDSAAVYYSKALKFSKEINDVAMEANILNAFGIIYYSQGMYGEALKYAEESLRKSSEINDEEGIAMGLGLLGNINFFSGNYFEAQKYHIQSIQIWEKSKDKIRIADASVYLASVYQALDKPEKGLQSLYRASRIYEELNDQYYLAQAYNNIGFIHRKMGATDSARIYYNMSIKQSLLSNNQTALNLSYMNMGNIYKDENNFEQSFNYFNKSITLAIKLNDKLLLSETYNNLGNLYAHSGYFDQALQNFKKAEKLALEVGSKDNLEAIYRNMSEIYEKMKDYALALGYFKSYTLYKDSMFNEDKTRKIEEMEARYQKEKQEKEIALQKTEIELLSKDLEIQTVKRDGLLIGLILSILGGIYVIVTFRQKMKRNKLIREQEKKLEEENLLIAQLERDNYEKELEFKKNELASHALHMIQKNELLDTLKSNIMELEKNHRDSNGSGFRQLKQIINGNVQIDKDWENFNRHFEQVHQGFYTKLKNEHQSLTSYDLRLAAMLRMNLSSKEVAAILNVSPESVKKARYRLRKKLQLEEEADLHSYMMTI